MTFIAQPTDAQVRATELDSPPRQYTREEYFALPEGPPYYELINGELVMSPRPLLRHQQLQTFLTANLWPHAVGVLGGELLGEPNLLLPGTTDVVHPDVLYLKPENLHLRQSLGVEGAPDMVCEILSPGTRRHDRGVKLRAYQKAKVAHVWFIEPQPPLQIEEYVLEADGRYRLEANLSSPQVWSPALFPGWTLDLAVAQSHIFQAAAPSNPTPKVDEELD